jgi:hypothetical protein
LKRIRGFKGPSDQKLFDSVSCSPPVLGFYKPEGRHIALRDAFEIRVCYPCSSIFSKYGIIKSDSKHPDNIFIYYLFLKLFHSNPWILGPLAPYQSTNSLIDEAKPAKTTLFSDIDP